MRHRLPALLLMALVSACALCAQELRPWARALEARGVTVSAGLWDVASGKGLERYQDDRALIPASTTKVVSTYALLKTLKPETTLETEIWGDLQDGVVQGDLVLKGAWDPLLTSERVWMLVQELKRLGLKRVNGRLRLDQGASDGIRQPRGWENTTANTLPTVLPLSVNFNRDEAGHVLLEPEAQSREIIQRLLQEAGVLVEGRPTAPGTPRKLLGWTSPPLRSLVQDINKWSNNFMVEMLLKSFGGGSWPRGVQRVQDFYQSAFGLGPEAIRITDGSGLSKDNRLSARTLAIILRAAYHDFEVGPEFVASLKIIGGEPWKLHIKDPNLDRRVRVKTGHLDLVSAACGYLQTPEGKVRIFAILLNGPAGEEDVWAQVSRWAN
jgi:D-alanyl-D-alanine carboxypeptidase/D-alanyl-D-alanine-endopeptidase (penicillin-binding protein 4)